MVGADPLRLTCRELVVWQASRSSRASAGRHALVQHITRLGLPDPSSVVDQLTARGLLVELAVHGGRAVEFGRRYRVVPIMLGLGNDPDRSSRYGIGFYAEPVLRVDGLVYRVWQRSHLEASLWAGCHTHASLARRAGLTDPQERDPVSVLNGFLVALPPLLAFGAAYVDLAGTR
jgi:hypothetical protein